MEEEVALYHSLRIGLLHDICRFGLAPSGHSHGITGLWCFAICSRDTFRWGSSVLEIFEGMVLTIKAPRYLLHRQSANTPVTEENIGRGLVSTPPRRHDWRMVTSRASLAKDYEVEEKN